MATIPLRARSTFYGWWILAAGTLMGAVYGLFFAVGLSVYFPVLLETFQAQRATLSWAFSLTRLENGLLGPIGGLLIDRLGVRKVMSLGLFLMGLGFIAMSQVQSVPAFFAAFLLIALGGGWAGFLPISTAMTNWFVRFRARAMGIALAGISAGGLLVPVLAWSISSFGWRPTSFATAFVLWGVGFPLIAVLRHRPEQYGYRPDGDAPGAAQEGSAYTDDERGAGGDWSGREQEEIEYTPVQALRSPSFWIIAVSHSLALLIVSAVMVHQVQYVVDMGASLVAASTVVTVTTVVSTIGRLVGGFFGDAFPKKPVLIGTYVLQSLGLLVLAISTELWHAYVFSVIYGFGWGARGPLIISIRGDYFGRRHYATIMGFSQPVMMLGLVAGPLVAGYAYDIQGSYQNAFFLIAAGNLLGGLLLFFLRKPRPFGAGQEAAT